jgi:hypothetical protein
MKAYGGVVFLTSTLVGGEWSASRSCRLIFGERHPVPIGEKVGRAPEPVWTTRRSENVLPYGDSNSDPSVVQFAASR